MKRDELLNRLGRVEPFDVLRAPLEAVEIQYRLQAAFAFAESRAELSFFETVAAGTGAGLLVVDTSEKILWLNPAAERLIGYDRETLTGRLLSLLLGPGETAAGIFDSDMPRPLTIRMARQDGSRFLAGCITGNISLPGGPGFTLVFSDVSEEKKRENELLLSAKVFEFSGEAIMITDGEDKILAVNPAFVEMTGYSAEEVGGRRPDLLNSGRQDYLTGLPNRVLLKDRFSQAAANTGRDGRKIAVLFLDLDKFKAINDQAGHTVGDRLLKQIAERLLDCLRSIDTVSRWGGDEFVLLFPGITATEHLSGIVEKISRSLQQPFTINGDVYRLSASIGVSFFPDHGADLDELLVHADSAMYTAKDMTDGSFAIFKKKE